MWSVMVGDKKTGGVVTRVFNYLNGRFIFVQ